MINLLPPEVKSAYRFARRNVLLSHWVFACTVAMIGLAALGTGGLIYIHQTTQNYTVQVLSMQDGLKKQDQTGVQNQVKDITNSLKLAVQVLSKEMLFSQLLTHLATVTPANAVLTDLNLAPSSQSAFDISALTTDYNTATQLQVNLADPANQLFSKADIVTITCTGGSVTALKYPCTVTIRALFKANDNPFLFINDGKKQP